MGKSKGVKKHRKTEIVFDESKRRDFLTGFRKRKEERRQKAKAEQETKIKAEIKLAKWVERKPCNFGTFLSYLLQALWCCNFLLRYLSCHFQRKSQKRLGECQVCFAPSCPGNWTFARRHLSYRHSWYGISYSFGYTFGSREKGKEKLQWRNLNLTRFLGNSVKWYYVHLDFLWQRIRRFVKTKHLK